MKIRLLLPVLAACTGPLCAQSPQPAGSPPPFPPHSGPAGDQTRERSHETPPLPPHSGSAGDQMRERPRDKMMENLPPEIRARFEAAREKAMQDPTIQDLKKKADAASEDLRKAMREAITKADPGLAELIKERVKDRMRDGKPGEPAGFANLSEGDRQKLMAAREKAKDDPAVLAAEELKKNAKTPEERHAAMEQFHKAMKAALLKADPTLGPILDQLKTPQDPPPAPGMNHAMGEKPGA